MASVPILKFLSNLFIGGEGAATEPFDGGEDVIGGFCPAEGFWIGIAGVDVGGNGGFELGGGPRRIPPYEGIAGDKGKAAPGLRRSRPFSTKAKDRSGCPLTIDS